MGFVSVLSFAHKLVEAAVRPGERVIDATAGGGNDALFLAKLVGNKGAVHIFDVQREALQQTEDKLRRNDIDTSDNIHFHHMSHHTMREAIAPTDHGHIGAVMFNLGYLPAGNHNLITTSSTTIPALESAIRLLRSGGIITIVLYPGHSGGDAESADVEQWATHLDRSLCQAMIYRFINGAAHAPYLIAIIKR